MEIVDSGSVTVFSALTGTFHMTLCNATAICPLNTQEYFLLPLEICFMPMKSLPVITVL